MDSEQRIYVHNDAILIMCSGFTDPTQYNLECFIVHAILMYLEMPRDLMHHCTL